MITIPAGVRIYLACGPTDMRNYAEHTIMQSPRRELRPAVTPATNFKGELGPPDLGS